MKTKYSMMAALLAFSGVAVAQEIDDMYFTARDRAQHNEQTNAAMAMRYAAYDQQAAQSNPVNPSDTYTGRGVNPEFSAQQKNGAEIIQGNPDYFLASYKPKDINSNLYSGSTSTSSNCACSPYSSSMAYGGFGNPYGSFYSPYGFNSPYMMGYGPSTMIGYTMSPYGSMWSVGMSYGMGSMYGSPYYGMYNPYGYGYGSGYGYGYPTSPGMGYDPVQTVGGRRPVRASTVNSSFPTGGTAGYVASGTHGRSRSTRTDYYDAQWRNDPSNFPTRSYSYGGRSSSFDSNGSTGRSWMDSQDYGSRSRSSFDSFGSSGRSSVGSFSGGSSGASSSGGRSRGRN